MITHLTKQMNNNSSHTMPHVMGENSTHLSHTGLVSEIIYDPQNPFTFHLLLPFVQQLSHQPRWQLWLAPDRRINRYWINSLGLPAQKTISLSSLSTEKSVEMMEKALSSGNFSSVIAWLPVITAEIKERLQHAAKLGDCYGFILQPSSMVQVNLPFNNMHWH
ncbi:SOS-induced cell division inhibitor SulA [Budvicia aquatica]|uniref:Cell division inhibitor SulA n=1 Tax=Budvicia aquatica TaxID=82979 RepID=A0A2C6DJ97_9GAMM|nr:SOS-induced cell division inhibitor SulA [Budvicia aquatica]PHI31306.1 cell division inhibitor SulA [Budvicia aquatica]GKX51818.1 cell division inhibitor SulA [Budvicia aquatica]VFS51608.1 Cell division inhibitor SulA [Budvicia aquatica]